jgi:WD40 repeat protein
VTFLNLVFIGDTLITSGDDGFLYLWEKERVVRRVFAHEGSIFSLTCNPKLGLLVSGGIEGIVTLWRLLIEQKSNVKSLERLKRYDLRRNLDP